MSAVEPAGDWPDGAGALALTVVKLAPDGGRVTGYAGSVVAAGAPPPWICVRAVWDNQPVELDGLRFLPGDTMLEFFSPTEWFNVFAVYAPGGHLRGWYGNVAYPTTFDPTTDPPTLTWHDRFLDVVLLPGGAPVLRDEDELASAGLNATDPALLASILRARDALLERARANAFPFHRADESDRRVRS